ncbi:hypothetical protein J6590_015310 [Homalodisca vitripennis]|nr:hypothetical protein J6590_015310 [Homalodisca vitripennis]
MRARIDTKLCLPAIICGDLPVINPDIINAVDLRNFRLMKESLLGAHVSFTVRKLSPLLEIITKCALRQIETGLTKYWKDAVLRRWPIYDNRYLMNEDNEPSFSEPRALQLTKLQPVFYMLLLGLAISSIVFLLEYLF